MMFNPRSFATIICSWLVVGGTPSCQAAQYVNAAKEAINNQLFDAPKRTYKHGEAVALDTEALSEAERLQLETNLLALVQQNYVAKGSPIFFVGGTGAGKSTTIGYLLNGALIYDTKEGTIEYKSPSMTLPPIGSRRNPGTLRPTIYSTEDLPLFLGDTEGYLGEREVKDQMEAFMGYLAPYFIFNVNQIGGIVFVIGSGALQNTRHPDFEKFVSYLLAQLGGVNPYCLKDSLYLMITKTGTEDEEDKVITDFHRLLKNFYEDLAAGQVKPPSNPEVSNADMAQFCNLFVEHDESKMVPGGAPPYPQNRDFELDESSILFVRPFKKERKRKERGKQQKIKRKDRCQYTLDKEAREALQEALQELQPIARKAIRQVNFPVVNQWLAVVAQEVTDLVEEQCALKEQIQELTALIKGGDDKDSLEKQKARIKKENVALEQKKRTLERDETYHCVHWEECRRYNPYKGYGKAIEEAVEEGGKGFEFDTKEAIASIVVNATVGTIDAGPVGTAAGGIWGGVSYALLSRGGWFGKGVGGLAGTISYPFAYMFKGRIVQEFTYRGEVIDRISYSSTTGTLTFKQPSLAALKKYFSYKEEPDGKKITLTRQKEAPFESYTLQYATKGGEDADSRIEFETQRCHLKASIAQVKKHEEEINKNVQKLEDLDKQGIQCQQDLQVAQQALGTVHEQLKRFTPQHRLLFERWQQCMLHPTAAEQQTLTAGVTALQAHLGIKQAVALEGQEEDDEKQP